MSAAMCSCSFEVCRQVRELYPDQQLPIIMVSAATEEDAVVQSLDCGADDYITKPFKRAELLARIKAKLSAVQEQVGVPACIGLQWCHLGRSWMLLAAGLHKSHNIFWLGQGLTSGKVACKQP